MVVIVELVALAVLVSVPRTPARGEIETVQLAGGAPDGSQTPPPLSGRRPLPTTTTVPPPPPTTTTVPAPSPPTTVARSSPPVTAAPAPVHAAVAVPVAGHAILPPANPPTSIPPQPNFLAACSARGYDDSGGCVASATAAIDNGRKAEGLSGMALPANWDALSPQEQLFVATNLERTIRGLPALSSMASVLDQAAGAGAAAGNDPSPPSGFPFSEWGANWAGGVGNPLEAVYYWMYDDGPGSSNADCTAADSGGCWGHRDKILLALSCGPCVMGTGFAPTGWAGQPSWAELLVATSGSPAADFTWQQESPYL